MAKKIAVITVIVLLVAAIAAAGIYLALSGADKDSDKEKDNKETTAQASGNNPTVPGQENEGNGSDNNTQANTLASQLLGKWRDGANMSGYEFMEGGKVILTYINLDIPGLESINGAVEGAYTLEGDKLTISTSIYTGTITDSYTASISGNVLTLVSTDDGDVSTYMRSEDTDVNTGADVTAPSQPTVEPEEPDGTDLAGSWVSSDGNIKYAFNTDGTVVFTRNGNEFSGVYIINKDDVSIQFTSGTDKVTEEFEYSISDNLLLLKGDNGRFELSRSGTAPSVGTSDELLGKWSDGAGMSGYEFKDAGIVDITYVNITIPVVNIPINGTYTGSYVIDGDSITINASIYGATISDTYTYSVNGNVLTLTAKDGNVSTYMKK